MRSAFARGTASGTGTGTGTGVPRVVLLERRLGDAVELLLGEDAEELPAEVEALEDGALLVGALSDELALELAEELEVEMVVGGERLLADDGLHRLHVLPDRVARVLHTNTHTSFYTILLSCLISLYHSGTAMYRHRTGPEADIGTDVPRVKREERSGSDRWGPGKGQSLILREIFRIFSKWFQKESVENNCSNR